MRLRTEGPYTVAAWLRPLQNTVRACGSSNKGRVLKYKVSKYRSH